MDRRMIFLSLPVLGQWILGPSCDHLRHGTEVLVLRSFYTHIDSGNRNNSPIINNLTQPLLPTFLKG